MSPDEIVAEIGRAQRFPRAALVAAGERRDEIAPRLLAAIEAWIAGDRAARTDDSLVFHGIHLLGEWRTPGAYGAICRLLAEKAAAVENLLGDAVTVTLPRILVGLFDGDPAPLAALAVATEVDDFVRSSSFDVLACLTVQGRLDRAWTVAFLTDCGERMRPRAESPAWVAWSNAVAALGARELLPAVKNAYDRDWVDPTWGHFRDFEKDLAAAEADPDRLHGPGADVAKPFESTVEELGTWPYAADPAPKTPPANVLRAPPLASGSPLVKPLRTVGRNDLCPCGSGKKFKKCCIDIYAGRS